MALGSLVRGIKSEQRRERQMTFVIDADAATPSITLGSRQATLVRNGVGDYTLTFRNAYGRAAIAIVTGAEADTAGYYANAGVASIDILITDLAGVAADNDVVVQVIGWDALDEV
jgi:hypothetical protein